MNSVVFASAFRAALAVQGIPAEMFVYMPRKLGAWRDALFLEELDFVMKMKHCCYRINMFIMYDNKQDPPFNNINLGPTPVE